MTFFVVMNEKGHPLLLCDCASYGIVATSRSFVATEAHSPHAVTVQ
jgi:hypothetical protein